MNQHLFWRIILGVFFLLQFIIKIEFTLSTDPYLVVVHCTSVTRSAVLRCSTPGHET